VSGVAGCSTDFISHVAGKTLPSNGTDLDQIVPLGVV
jgi:hypothetical protein